MKNVSLQALAGFAVATLCVLAAPQASALEQTQGADLQRFTPAVDPLGAFSAGSGDVLAPGGFAVGLHLNYARNPLVVREDGERTAASLQNVLAVQLHGAFHLLSFLELGFGIPFVAYQNGNDPLVDPIAAQALGDLEIQPRFRLLNQMRHGVSLSVTPGVTIPLGNEKALSGNGSFTFTPRASISHIFERAFVSGEVWFNMRPEVEVLQYATVGNELGLRVAGGLSVTDSTELVLEADGALAFATTSRGVEGTPLELIGGVRHHLNENVAIEFGVGVGVLSAPGVPDFRVVTGVNFGRGLKRELIKCERIAADGTFESIVASGKDTDGDGIDDACDLCPNVAEDMNGYQDFDGCPDPDRDGDGVFDEFDECPDVAGVKPSGCPDSDGDGILDRDDECPNEPGVAPTGCPDRDGDGILDRDDQCPDEAGVAPHGCPDRDGDGVLDADDFCPDKAGPKPHGCPDSDGDGIPDHLDKCPNEKETINGFEDEDGCPDVGRSLVVVQKDRIAILDIVHFDTDKDVIQSRSFGLLKQVALTIKANPEITNLRVEGHTDDVGGHVHNLDLSQRRAESVVRFLVAEGVEEGRLVAKGFSFDRPVRPNTNKKNRAANRRVEFNIIADEPVDAAQ